jgi:hypothetical protein
MREAHPNVLKAIADMEAHLSSLLAGCTDEQRRAISKDAVTCHDLMNYSHEVADTKHPAWIKLDGLVAAVMRAAA